MRQAGAVGSLEMLPVTRRQPADGAAARRRWRRPPISSFVGAPHPLLHDHPTVAALHECWCGQTDVRVPAGRRPCRGLGPPSRVLLPRGPTTPPLAVPDTRSWHDCYRHARHRVAMGGERGPVGGKTWGCAGPRVRRGGIQVASDVGLLDVDAARTGAQTTSCVSSCRSNSLE